ncbi:MAG: hypothetical protein HC828_18865 [Blastochloris sp.]|nr:hypothetical protein [Blastochloris sp.]
MPAEEREALLAIWRGQGTVEELPSATLSVDWLTFIALIDQVGTVASGAAAAVTLANQLNQWRQRNLKQGHATTAHIQRPNGDTINLATSTDQQVLEWLLESGSS